MQAPPRCVECGVQRVSVSVEWIAQRYDVRSFECPHCKTVLRLVELRKPVTLH